MHTPYTMSVKINAFPATYKYPLCLLRWSLGFSPPFYWSELYWLIKNNKFKLQITLYLHGIHLFQVHNSMICINFTEWCDHHHKSVLKHLCSPQKTPSCPFQLIFDPLCSWATTNLLSLYIHWPFLDISYINGIIQYMVSYIWLLSLSIFFSLLPIM